MDMQGNVENGSRVIYRREEDLFTRDYFIANNGHF